MFPSPLPVFPGTMAAMTDETESDWPADDDVILLPASVWAAIRADLALDDDPGD